MTNSNREGRAPDDPQRPDTSEPQEGDDQPPAGGYVFKILPADPKANSADFEDVADK